MKYLLYLFGAIKRERLTCIRVGCKNERPKDKICCEEHQKEVNKA